jgi:Replicative DNA helicase
MPRPRNKSDFPAGVQPPLDLNEVVTGVVRPRLEKGTVGLFDPIPTGFGFDRVLGGGLHAGDLAILGGMQNVGKTAGVLQVAYNAAAQGDALSIVICYEHDTHSLWERLLIQQSWEPGATEWVTSKAVQEAYVQVIRLRDELDKEGKAGDVNYISELIARLPRGSVSWQHLTDVQKNIWLVTGDQRYTSLDAIGAYVRLAVDLGYKRILLILDYIQKIPVFDAARNIPPEERVERLTGGLKSMVLRKKDEGVVVAALTVAAADAEGLRNGRVHMENLWGNAAVQYDPDIGIIMNRDPASTEDRVLVRFAIEKNRHGPSDIEFRHHYVGAAYTFEPEGEKIQENESWQAERRELKAESDPRRPIGI